MIYNVQGDFGKVRSFMHLPSQMAKDLLCYTTSAGWHLCNDKYRISRDKGFEDYLVFFTISGCGHLRLQNEMYLLTAGTTMIVPAHVSHEYFVQPDETWEFYWLHVNGIAAVSMFEYIQEHHGVLLETSSVNSDIHHEIEDLIAYKGINKPTFEVYASVILYNILHEILIGLQEKEQSGLGGANAVRELIKHMEKNFNQPISIKDICQTFYMSSGHLSRLFRAKIGYSPYEYLLRYRIIKSKELLLYTDNTISEVARMTGFCSASNYICKFKAIENITPEQFRKYARVGVTMPSVI